MDPATILWLGIATSITQIVLQSMQTGQPVDVAACRAAIAAADVDAAAGDAALGKLESGT
jgi:hypothetical protein